MLDNSSPTQQDRSDSTPRSADVAGSRMERLAGFAQRRHWTALAVWIALLVGVVLASQTVGDDFGNGSDVSLPGTESAQVAALLRDLAPEQTGDSVVVVLHDERGWDADVDEEQLRTEIGAIDRVETVALPDPAAATASADGTLGLVQVALEGERGAAPRAVYQEIVDVAQAHATRDLQVELSGKGIEKLEQSAGSTAELAGLVMALVILVMMFGSLLAASLPLITAVLAVGTTIGLAGFLSHLIAIPDYTTALLGLVGLGVGIDYALIVFSRFRSELLGGSDRSRATRIALDTAGRSVLFAGLSVILAMLGMFALGIDAFEGMVTAVALTVLVTMVASLTLLPALLSLFGARIERSVQRRAARSSRAPGERWRRWAWLVQRARWPALLGSVLVLSILALPVLGMRLGLSDAGSDPEDTTARAAYDLVAEKMGPGANGPLIVLVRGTQPQADAVHDELAQHAGVAADSVRPPVRLADDVHLIRAHPTSGPQDAGTSEVVEDLRQDLGPEVLVGGATAANIDYSAAIADRFPLFVGLVVALSALLLLSVFRSWVLAVKAAVFNLLSIGAALGVMKLVYQDGRLWADVGPIEAFMPVFIFALVFGLSMDYEVFLLSRIREVWCRTGDAQHAIREGIASTGGVITAAAAIMFVVFGSFALVPDRMLAQSGFAMAFGVLVDAVVIRSLMVPAVMSLLGDRAWGLPAVLDRWLPHLHVEGRAGEESSAVDSATAGAGRA